ncbi:putative Major facilitator superfamily (MFS) profile domain-containing protein [Seiridium cardinale]|uniref:Major facilitator superfamily (MFS) profile domain-containing protein n=1 Tax=Seiridium cardinale TaxID=138064 RepID=A0ABR2XRA3_9PEZI
MAEKGHIVPEPQRASSKGPQQDPSCLEKGQFNDNYSPQLFVVQGEQPPEPAAGDTSDSASDPQTLLQDETYPEGGLEAWLVVFGSFCGLVASLGLMNSIAIFQTYNAAHQLSNYSTGTVGWIYSIYTFLAFGCGVYIGPWFDKYGPRWLLLPGGVGIVASLMLMSICTPKRGLATGIASSGGSVGGVVFPLILQRLFDRLGWAWSLRILGFICLLFLIICNLLVKKRLPPAQNASSHPDFMIFRDKAFLFTTLGVFMLEFGLFIPIAYISSYSLHVGFDDSFSFYILTILNASSVFGRLLPGYWADIMGPFNSNMFSVLITMIATFAVWLPAGHTLPGIVIFAILFGFGTGSNISITPVCVGKLCHTQHYGRAGASGMYRICHCIGVLFNNDSSDDIHMDTVVRSWRIHLFSQRLLAGIARVCTLPSRLPARLPPPPSIACRTGNITFARRAVDPHHVPIPPRAWCSNEGELFKTGVAYVFGGADEHRR